MPIKRQTYRLDQIDDWQGPVQQSGPTRDAAAQRVRDRLTGMSPTERVLSELTERPPTPRAAFPLRENAQTSRPMPPMAGQMFLDAGLGVLEALDQPPTGLPPGMRYTTPLRLLSASGAVPSALAARAYDASSRGSVMADAPVVDPLRPAGEQSMFSTAIAQRGGGKGAQALGLVADLLTPDFTDALTGGLLPLAAMAGSLKRVNTGRTLINGLYSRLDEAASMIPTKGVPATGVLNWLKKAPEGISLEEVAYRKLPEWLESQGTKTVTPEMLAAHLRENPAPFPQVKTLGVPSRVSDTALDDKLRRLGLRVDPIDDYYKELYRISDGPNANPLTLDELEKLPQDVTDAFEGALTGERRHSPLGLLRRNRATKFSQYQVPGGENYRETLLTLSRQDDDYDRFVRSMQQKYGDKYYGNMSEAELDQMDALRESTSVMAPDGSLVATNTFRSSHFPDAPNLLVHTRANDRTLPTGEPGRFVEEVQSDWWHELEKGKVGNVPDAPFKDTWPDLGLKQQLIETANDPNAEWMGFTGGKTQADRYDLSKQIDSVDVRKLDTGKFVVYANKNNEQVAQKITDADGLAKVIGKELADKVRQDASLHTNVGQGAFSKQYSGLDLQVGGEGMTAFYDQKLPKRLEKLVKPFGGTVEPVALTPNRMAKVGSGPVVDEPNASWLSRLTPEMKAAMRERGFPLMSLAGPVAAQGIPDDPNSETDDYARLALNMGSMASLGMAAKGIAGSAPNSKSLSDLWHSISEKRLNMPVSEMQYTHSVDPSASMPQRRIMRPEDFAGGAIVPAVGDRTRAGYMLDSVGGTKLPTPVKLQGGPDFMRTHSDTGAVWASKSGPVTGMTNRIVEASKASKKAGGTGKVFLVYVPGKHGMSDFSTMMTEALLEQIKGGKFTKKAVQEFDKYVKGIRPEWKGLMHPESRTQLGKNGLLRHAFADAVELKSMQDMGFPDIAQTRAAITEPALLDTPNYSGGFAVSEVNGRIIRDSPLPHPTYDTQMGGTYVGAMERPIDYKDLFPDWAEKRATGGGAGRRYDKRSFMTTVPYQLVTDKWVKKNSGKLQSMGMVAVPVAAGAAAMQSDKPKNGRKTYRLDQIDR